MLQFLLCPDHRYISGCCPREYHPMRNFLAIDIFSSNNSCFLSAAAFCRALSLSALALWRAFFLSCFFFFYGFLYGFLVFLHSKSLPTFVISIHLFILSESSLRITLSVNTISPDNKNLCISGESIFFTISKHLTIQFLHFLFCFMYQRQDDKLHLFFIRQNLS